MGKINLNRVLDKYFEFVVSETLLKHEKELSRRIINGLSAGYLRGLDEPKLVRILDDLINSIGSFSSKSRQDFFELSTKSIFIHGQKSQVQFEYYGKKTRPIELGDLIFIVSIFFNGDKYFEKMTINQFKRDPKKTRGKQESTSWSLSKRKQLYLLSRFPIFTSVRGLIPKRDYNLPNHSGCLGSYGLLHEPGDFAFVSATRLDSYMGGKSSLRRTELHRLEYPEVSQYYGWMPFFYPLILGVFGNCHFSNSANRFVYHYLRMNIGELVYSKFGLDNFQAREFLDGLKASIETKARKEKSTPLLRFLRSFNKSPYARKDEQNGSNKDIKFDSEGGGLGIIYTSINLGE